MFDKLSLHKQYSVNCSNFLSCGCAQSSCCTSVFIRKKNLRNMCDTVLWVIDLKMFLFVC